MEKSARIEKIANGWEVNFSWEEKLANGDTEYKDEEWYFETLEGALAKAKEILEVK